MNTTAIVVVAVLWPAVGVLSGVLMARRGYDPLWILIGLPLGPLFLPIALERIRRRPALAEFGVRGAPPGRAQAAATGTRILVGLDGSGQSARALDTVLRLFAPNGGLLVLTEVVSYEATEDATRTVIDAASQRLSEVAAGIDPAWVVHTEVLAGPPGPALRRFAEHQEMDLLVVGRRGTGRSVRLLGSVSADLVENSPIPVLVVEPPD